MADDKSKRDGRDRAQVSSTETYEIDYFARKHGLSRDEARELIDRVGNNREALDTAAAERSSTTAKPRRGRRTTAAGTAAKEPETAAAKRMKRSAKAAPDETGPVTLPLVASVEAAASTVVEPVGKAVAPARRKVATTVSKVAATTRKNAKAASDTVAKAPAMLGSGASEAAKSVKVAATGRVASVVGAAAAGLVTGLVLNLGRKVVVQAPSAAAGDWFEAVKLEHTLALSLFDTLQATDDGSVSQRGALLTQLKHALSKHAFTEENVLYPALRAWGDTADADKLNHDHGYVKQYLYDLEQMDDASPAFLEKVAEFRAQLEEHIREEETSIFPPLHAALGAAENARVTALANKEGFKLA